MNNNDEATEEDIRNVLGSIEDIQIRGEYRTGDDIGRLDNVVLESICVPSAAPVAPPTSLSERMAVGSQSELSGRSGTLYLRVNDSPASLKNNAGTVSVRITRAR